MEASASIRGSAVKTNIRSVADSLDSPSANIPMKPKDARAMHNVTAKPLQQADENFHIGQPHPFFYHTNTTTHSFTLHAPPSHVTYHTTIGLILFLHLLYIYQWNKRLSRSDVATNYDQLVNKRQYWRGLLAILSHPPVEGGERDVGRDDYSSHISDISVGENENSNVTRRFRAAWILYARIQSVFRATCAPARVFAKKILHPLVFGHLSGLPLLTYVSHILWQCRALEEVYDVHNGRLILGLQDGEQASKFISMASQIVSIASNENASTKLEQGNSVTSYIRVLIALTTTSICLEISLLRAILRRMDRHMDFTGYTTTPRGLLSQRAICSLTSLSAAVLSVYDAMFPYSPPPVLPFVKVPLLSSSGFSLLFSIVILCILTHRIHPVTSVVSGLLSGTLWALGVTSFLGTRYWGNAMFGTLIGAILLSLKSNQSYSIYLGMALPCLDYVSWDSDGEIHDLNTIPTASSYFRSNPGRLESGGTSFSESNDIADYSDSQQPASIMERRPLLSSATNSTLSNESAIRGRVPFINSMESDFDDGSSSASNAGARSDGNLSRRARNA